MTDPWPWPSDTPCERARRIANSLLALLSESDRDMAIRKARAVGETWLGEQLLLYTADQAITTAQAAAMLSVSQDVIRQWACRPHPDGSGRALLPRAGRRGREMTYLVRNVLDASYHSRRGSLTSANL